MASRKEREVIKVGNNISKLGVFAPLRDQIPVLFRRDYINSRTNDFATSEAIPSGRRASGPPSSRIGSS